MNRLPITITPVAIILILSSIVASGEEIVKEGRSEKTIAKTTNLHYTGQYCTECHTTIPAKSDSKALRFNGDFNKLCWCHGYVSGTYIHPVDVAPSEEKRKKIPPDLPLREGKVVCSTCHDIYMQCRENPEMKFSNTRFLRGFPYQKRTDLCFKCHDKKKYKRLDPHVQLNENGGIIAEKCLYCHIEKPEETHADFEKIKLIGDLTDICQRCHMKTLKHPADANHMVVPSAKIFLMMKEVEKQFGIVLPLDYNGKIFCATCHNPHERGVIPAERLGAKGSGEAVRQRLPGKICIACHEK